MKLLSICPRKKFDSMNIHLCKIFFLLILYPWSRLGKFNDKTQLHSCRMNRKANALVQVRTSFFLSRHKLMKDTKVVNTVEIHITALSFNGIVVMALAVWKVFSLRDIFREWNDWAFEGKLLRQMISHLNLESMFASSQSQMAMLFCNHYKWR